MRGSCSIRRSYLVWGLATALIAAVLIARGILGFEEPPLSSEEGFQLSGIAILSAGVPMAVMAVVMLWEGFRGGQQS